jgi:hypothetical protein
MLPSCFSKKEVKYVPLAAHVEMTLISRRACFAGAGQSTAQNLALNASQWMMVPQSQVTMDGSQCNLVGTSYYAFNFQSVCLGSLLVHEPLTPCSACWQVNESCCQTLRMRVYICRHACKISYLHVTL